MVATRRGTYGNTSMVAADAVLGVVGSQTAASLMSGGRSKKLGAGMATMVSLTKGKMATKAPHRPLSASKRLLHTQRLTRADEKAFRAATRGPRKSTKGRMSATKGRKRATATLRGNGLVANWSGAGVPYRVGAGRMSARMSAKGRMSTRGMSARGMSASACTKPCPANKVRNPKSCRCVKAGGDAARKLGICTPRIDAHGRKYETVLVTGTYKSGARRGKAFSRCVKAGGGAARDALGAKGCPVGKVLKSYTARVPTPGGGMRSVRASRCIKATGALKDCPANQVVVSVRASGVAPNGRPWAKNVKRCVTKATAAKKGYNVVKQGTLPVRKYARITSRKVNSTRRRATSHYAGNNLRVNWGGRGLPRHVAMSVGM
jgi:hypothetical protein